MVYPSINKNWSRHYEHSYSPNTTMTELGCRIQRFYFPQTFPRICWGKLRDRKITKMLKTINNLEVPCDWKNTLISQLKHSEPNCSAAPLFENIKTIQMKDNILVSPVGRRRSKNHYTSNTISLSIKSMTRKARMLPTYHHQEMDSSGFKISDVIDGKYKDIWGSWNLYW